MPAEADRMPEFMEWNELTSLVGSLRTSSLVSRPKTVEECRQTLEFCRSHGFTVCARGAGRGYGDLALNDGQVVMDMSGMNRILSFDAGRREITVEAGTRLIDIYRTVHHHLLTLRASPTESHSSVAGAICANVNGKDAWRHGSFAHQVSRLTLMTADGRTIEIGRDDELFNAVVGGIGMLGVIVHATLRLEAVPSPYVEIERIPVSGVDSLLDTMREVERTYDAAVVWIDAYARGKRAGRAVIHAARWIEREQPLEQRRTALEKGYERLERHRRFGLGVHERFGPLLSLMLQLQRPMMRTFNALYHAMGRLLWAIGRSSNVELFLRFAFEASFTVPPAHLVCGPRGYTVQLTFPREQARDAILEMLSICRSSPCPPVTTILRAHRADDCLISFSENGYSLNFEFHPKRRNEQGSREAVDRLIDATARRGGKIHLAKDQVLRPEQFYRIFPRYRDLLAIKKRLDPDGLFASDLARRVGIDPSSTPEAPGEDERRRVSGTA